MWRALPLLGLCVLGARSASATPGHTAQSNRIAIDPATSRIYLHTNLGLLVSENSGETFWWVCSAAAGGHPAPKLAVRDGALLTITLEGIGYSSDGARTFSTATVWPRATHRDQDALVPLTDLFYSSLEVSSDNRVWIASATGGARDDVFVSDDGRNFHPVGGRLAAGGVLDPNAWWRSLKVAPGDPEIVYLSGAIPPPEPGEPETPLLYRSSDGGDTWAALDTSGLDLSQNRSIEVEGVSPATPDTVFVRSRSLVAADILYRSSDGGSSWQEVFRAPQLDTFVLSAGGDRVLSGGAAPCGGDDTARASGCAALSTEGGTPDSFALVNAAPRMACGVGAADGSYFVCSDEIVDSASLSHSPDGGEWTAVHRFSDILGPLDAPAGSVQDGCTDDWDIICAMYGSCTTAGEADAGPGETDRPESGGCIGCSSGTGGATPLATALLLAALLRRRRSAS